MAGNVNSLAWFARLTFVRGRFVPSLPNVLQSWVAPEALPWQSPQTHFGAHCSLLPSGSSTHPASLPASHLLLSQGCTSPWPTNGPVPLAPGVNYTLEPKQAAWPLPPTRFATAQGVASPSSNLCHWSILELGFGNPPLPVEPSEEWESTEVRLTSLTLLNRFTRFFSLDLSHTATKTSLWAPEKAQITREKCVFPTRLASCWIKLVTKRVLPKRRYC